MVDVDTSLFLFIQFNFRGFLCGFNLEKMKRIVSLNCVEDEMGTGESGHLRNGAKSTADWKRASFQRPLTALFRSASYMGIGSYVVTSHRLIWISTNPAPALYPFNVMISFAC